MTNMRLNLPAQKIKRILSGLFLATSFCSISAFALETPPPTKDVDNLGDHPLVGRFEGSVVVARDQLSYDEVALPVSALKPVPNELDAQKNKKQTADKLLNVAGKRQRTVYLIPNGHSLTEIVANYKSALTAKGATSVYECNKQNCGGGNRILLGGGSSQSIGMLLWSAEKARALPPMGAAACAQNAATSDSQYNVFALPNNVHVAIQTYQLASAFCSSWSGKQVAIIDVIEPAEIQQKMVVVNADQMAQSIKNQGRIALYGIYFDSGAANVKPESEKEISEIAKLLTQQTNLKLLVVGHTDDAGSYAENLTLSKQRADAVVAELTKKHQITASRLQAVGISFASPVATNSSEEGKAKNRRVELVPFK